MNFISIKKWTAAVLVSMMVSIPAWAETAEPGETAVLENTPAAQQTAADEVQEPDTTQTEDPAAQSESVPPETKESKEPAQQPSASPESEPTQDASVSEPEPTEPVHQTARVWLEQSKESFSAGQTMKCVLRREGGEQALEVRYSFNGQTYVQTLKAGENSMKIQLGEAPESDKALTYELSLIEDEQYEIKGDSLEIQVAPLAVFGFETSYAGSVGSASGDSCKIVIQRSDNGAQQSAKVALSMPESAYEAGYRLTGDQKHFQLDTTYYIEFKKGEMQKTVYLSNWSAAIEQSTTIRLSLQAGKGAMIEKGGDQVNVTLAAKDSNSHLVSGRFTEGSLYVTPGENIEVEVALDWADPSESARLKYEITDGQDYRKEGEMGLNPGQDYVRIPLSTDDFQAGCSYVVNILPETENDVGSQEGSGLILYAIEDSENPTASLDSAEYLIMPGQSLKLEISIDKVQPENITFILSLGERRWNAVLPAGQERIELELDSIKQGGTLKLSAPNGVLLKTAQAEVTVSAALSDNLNFAYGRVVYCDGDGNARISIKLGEPLDESTRFVLGISDDETGNMINITIPAGRTEYVAELPERMMKDYAPGTECQLTLDMPEEAWQGKIAQAKLSVLENAPDLAGFEVEQIEAQVGDKVEVPLDLPRNFEGLVTLTEPNGGKQTLYPRYPLGSVEFEVKREGHYYLILSDEKNGWVDENKDEVLIVVSAE